ncbi:MAG: hypothetical protein CMD96_04905 [Gammaproteobacteria bacterium]|jgi:response regulator RpfG family c-di-GMP phosphodiesterase|nr:hypothetical protein [Gammaproteobacteria bacterium]HJP19602.1 response regulator [Nitrospinota bacterium]|tara:strand:+ start:2773 stop:3927 length:1155 start_codon:yes stop_codon:yes gene_type:complete
MANILIVDDQKINRDLLQDLVVDLGHVPLTAENGLTALALLKEQCPDIILLDILMPEMDGFEVLNNLKDNSSLRHIPVIMISAVDEIKSVVRCIEKGADDYLTKPFNPTLLKARIGACLEKYRLIKTEREFLDKTLRGSVKVLTDILSILSPEAFGQASRERLLVGRIAKEMKVKKIWELELSAMFSPLGCITVPPAILDKLSHGLDLLPKEEEIFSEHPKIGHDLIVNLPHLEKVAKIIANQNKHFDFDQEASTSCHSEVDVPFGVQILSVAKDFDAFVSSGLEPAEAYKRLRDKGKYYNQFILDALSSLVLEKPAQKTRSLKIEELSVGMVFVENLTAASGQFICSKGTVIDVLLLNRIINFSSVMEIIEPVKVILPSTDQR